VTADDEEALSRLVLASFVEESAEHAQALKTDALRLESSSGKDRAEILHVIFRTVHTIKGASRAAGVSTVESASHAMEDLLEQLRAHPDSVTPAHVTRILTFGDALEHVGPELARTGTLDGSIVERELLEIAGPTTTADGPASRAEPAAADDGSGGTIRLALGRVDALIALATELDESVARANDTSSENGAPSGASGAGVEARRMTRLSRALVTAVRDLRQLPFAAACLGLDRVAREAALTTGRDVAFVVAGTEIGFDREIVKALRETLIHLVRNAIDHGCEAPEERVRSGKTARATVRVEARVRASDLVVSVEDDGRGFDVGALRAASGSPAAVLTDDDAVQIAFSPGISTASVVTALSGRGVGLNIVRTRIEDLRGAVAVTFRKGEGTCIALTVPMRRSSVRAVTALAGTALVVVPTPAIERLVRVARSSLVVSGGRLVLPDARGPIPVGELAALLGEPSAPDGGPNVLLIVLASHGRTAAIAVNDVVEEREVAVTALPARLAGARLVSGVTVLGGGELALVLHTGELIEQTARATGGVRPTAAASRPRRRPTVLLVDDSLTTRTLERSILEGAGFTVLTASDGEEAWQLLASRPVDAVVSDVEMPNVDGLELTRRIRSAVRFRALPVLLVTGKASDEDRTLGLDAGANAYIVKRAFDQELLIATLRSLL
jgi:two-component system, chemotaxis family, sensor kinase CheA